MHLDAQRGAASLFLSQPLARHNSAGRVSHGGGLQPPTSLTRIRNTSSHCPLYGLVPFSLRNDCNNTCRTSVFPSVVCLFCFCFFLVGGSCSWDRCRASHLPANSAKDKDPKSGKTPWPWHGEGRSLTSPAYGPSWLPVRALFG